MIVVIDHYDSFVETLARYVREAGHETRIINQDDVSAGDVVALNPDGIILSPGPGGPENTGVSMPLINLLDGRVPILGVCLGHLALAAAYGGPVTRAREPMHGKSAPISHEGGTLFSNMPNPFNAGRYHALIVSDLPACMSATAHSGNGEIMGLTHRSAPLYGVQFHPESVLTPQGRCIVTNFLARTHPSKNIHPAARA